MDNTDQFAVFGNPISQSLSPAMHNAAFSAMGLKAHYRAVRTNDATEVVRLIREEGIRGASITHPLKETLMPLLDDLDESARMIGAVNTIVSRDGRLAGHNTDGVGLLSDLAEWIEISGRSFVILGAGGAARAALFALRNAGGNLIVVNRTPGRARNLAEEFRCGWASLEEIEQVEADCLINTTPVGMFPEADRTPLDGRFLVQFAAVMDMIYNPLETRLMREAKAAGCDVRSGIGMFVHQGAEQILLWTGIEPPRDLMRQTVRKRLEHHGGD